MNDVFSKVIFFFLIFIIFNGNSYASQPFCEGLENNQKPKKIKHINIKVNNYKSFQVNAINILTDISLNIKKEFKKKFKSKINIEYLDNTVCYFEGEVRQNGDLRDHITFQDNKIKQSLDVKLLNGHINGITKFKLFLPGTRNDSEDELLLTEILRYLGFLSPRSYIVNTRVNDTSSRMLLQEKTAKELLEFNKKREGPILEGSEIFQSKFLSQINREVTNMEKKITNQLDKGAKIQLSKTVNSNWSIKNKKNLYNSFNVNSYLNKIYLLYIKSYQNSKYNYQHVNYTLNNLYLAHKDFQNQIKLDNFNLILLAFGASHALIPKNRKFYWDSFNEYFEPIYYDGNIDLNSNIKILNPISPSALKLIPELQKKFENIDLEIIYENLKVYGSELSKEHLKNKLDIVKSNLSILEKDFRSRLEEIDYNFSINLDPSDWDLYFNLVNEIYPSVKFVTYKNYKKQNNNYDFLYLDPCNKSLFNCDKSEYFFIKNNKRKIRKILESDYEEKKQVFQYLVNENYNIENKKFYNFKKENINDSNFYFEEGIEFILKNNVLDIFQKSPEARALFVGKKIDGLEINFFGLKDNYEIKDLANYPSNEKNLTGCLSFINIEFSNVDISSSNSNCEDSINLINVTGDINKIKIENSISDGLDIDFSEIKINDVKISKSNNDCLDVSLGIYLFKKLDLSECGDKGLSVGEDSTVNISKLKINGSETGVATKDSSYAQIENSTINNVVNCYSAYNKKQEFSGAKIYVIDSKCKNFTNKINTDPFSEIKISKNN